MSSPTTPPEKGVPLGRILLILSVFGIPGIVYLGVRHLGSYVKIVEHPDRRGVAIPRQALAHRVSSGQDTCELDESVATKCFAIMEFGTGHVLGGLLRHAVG